MIKRIHRRQFQSDCFDRLSHALIFGAFFANQIIDHQPNFDQHHQHPTTTSSDITESCWNTPTSLRGITKSKRKMYYAVAKGRKTGVYTSWDDCQAQVIGYAQNQYTAFATKSEAEHYVQQYGNTAPSHTQPFQGTASPVSSHFQSATQEDSRKRMLVENYRTPDCKRPRPTPTETNNNSSNQYQYSYYADYGVEDDDDPLRDYYHSHGFYGYLFQRSGKW